MIFLTVGVQLPFDRLVRAVDEWAGRTGRSDVVAQTGASTYSCRHIDAKPYLGLAEFNACVKQAELVVAHAGMGSIITALELGKPIVVVPRRASLMEHRNDHQLSTARHMAEHGLITVAQDEQQLVAMLDDSLQWRQARQISGDASDELIDSLRAFIGGDPGPSLVARLFGAFKGVRQRPAR